MIRCLRSVTTTPSLELVCHLLSSFVSFVRRLPHPLHACGVYTLPGLAKPVTLARPKPQPTSNAVADWVVAESADQTGALLRATPFIPSRPVPQYENNLFVVFCALKVPRRYL